eukprot:TRINITY_DN5162_c0_g1_i1.p1 TRINITY_DN5162_c0_g1~~TRINITY_DN5162_c0_g1_i1.p1  ORF type:complete len:178 (-),score=40.68 TRINITY_DN5162_c0_g1_i1:45-578(-)
MDNVAVMPWHMKLIIREFQPQLPIEGEFRGFVCRRRLNALSQYYADCYFPSVVEHKDELAQRVLHFYEEHIRDLLPMDDYVVDFAVMDKTTIKVIELNPFGPTTGGGLFDWKVDRAIIENGPFTIRVVTDVPPTLAANRLLLWTSLLAQAEQPEQNATEAKPAQQQEVSDQGNCVTM